MGCPVSKRVQTATDNSTANTQNCSDENSNGFQSPSKKEKKSLDMKSNNHQIDQVPEKLINHHTSAVILKNRPSTRTKSQVEFFAMLDSKIEAGRDLEEECES